MKPEKKSMFFMKLGKNKRACFQYKFLLFIISPTYLFYLLL